MMMRILKAVLAVTVLSSPLAAAEVMDVGHYGTVATEVIRESMKGSGADTDKMVRQCEELIQMGIASSRAYAAENPQYEKLLTLTADNANGMKAMSLEQIEEEWHEFGLLLRHGIDAESIEHFGAAISLMDTIVHPATSIIAIHAYQQERDEEYLEQVKAELSEVLEHIKHINQGGTH